MATPWRSYARRPVVLVSDDEALPVPVLTLQPDRSILLALSAVP